MGTSSKDQNGGKMIQTCSLHHKDFPDLDIMLGSTFIRLIFAVSCASRHARCWQRNSGQCPHGTRAPTLYHPGRTCRKEGSE